MPVPSRDARSADRGRPGAAIALLAAVQVTLIAAITVIVVPLPAIARELGLSQGELALVSAAYGLAFSGLLLLGGRLADLLGRRRVLVVGVATFGVASAAAGFAPGLGVLLTARFAQGGGAALTAPAAMALLGAVYPDPGRRARAVAAWGGLCACGAIVGTLLSGLIVTWFSWRWAFVLPVLVAAVAVGAAPRLLPPGPPPAPTRLDLPGAVLATTGLSALSYGLVEAADRSWSAAAVLWPLVGGGALLATVAAVEARAAAPLLPPSFFASRRLAALLAVVLTAAGSATSTFFLALYFQQVRGLSPLLTSAAFLPYALVIPAGLVAGRLVGRIGARAATAIGMAVAAAGLLLLSRIGVDTRYAGALLAGLVVFPIGMGLAFAGATLAAVDGVPDRQAGLAGGVVNTAMETGPTVGLALLVSLAGTHANRLHAGGVDPAAAATAGYALALGVAALAFVAVAAFTAVALRPAPKLAASGRTGTVRCLSEAAD